MSSEINSNQANSDEVDPHAQKLAEAIERIKQPPAIDDVMRQLSPDELLSNPAVAPEMLNEGEGLRDDLKRDE